MLGKQEIIALNKRNWLSYTKRDFDSKSLCLQECSDTLAKCQVSVAPTEGNLIFKKRIRIGCPWLCFIVWHLLSQNMQWLFSTQ